MNPPPAKATVPTRGTSASSARRAASTNAVERHSILPIPVDDEETGARSNLEHRESHCFELRQVNGVAADPWPALAAERREPGALAVEAHDPEPRSTPGAAELLRVETGRLDAGDELEQPPHERRLARARGAHDEDSRRHGLMEAAAGIRRRRAKRGRSWHTAGSLPHRTRTSVRRA